MTGDDQEPVDDAMRLAREIADAYGRRSASSPGNPSSTAPRRRPTPPRRPQREDPSSIGDLLGEVVRDQGWDERLSSQRVFTEWPRIVGPEVAQHSEVVAFEDGIVHIRTDKTAWARELTFLAPRLVAKLNAELGDGSVVRISVEGPQAPSWSKGRRSIRGARGPRDTYG